jgi:hypothetical protein
MAVWTTNPITITFSHTSGTNHVSDPFKCAPAFSSTVVLTTTVDKPLLVSLTLSRSTFPTCGVNFNPLTITAHSTVAGTYRGTVSIHKGSQYGNTILPNLSITIKVT